jgi:hypothetical protein
MLARGGKNLRACPVFPKAHVADRPIHIGLRALVCGRGIEFGGFSRLAWEVFLSAKLRGCLAIRGLSFFIFVNLPHLMQPCTSSIQLYGLMIWYHIRSCLPPMTNQNLCYEKTCINCQILVFCFVRDRVDFWVDIFHTWIFPSLWIVYKSGLGNVKVWIHVHQTPKWQAFFCPAHESSEATVLT